MPRAATGRGCSKSSRASPRSSTTPPAAPAVSKESPCRSGFSRELFVAQADPTRPARSEEHTSELQSLMRISYAVFCLKKKNTKTPTQTQVLHQKTTKHITKT